MGKDIKTMVTVLWPSFLIIGAIMLGLYLSGVPLMRDTPKVPVHTHCEGH